jgi:ABC-type ATPase involved in cell division
MVEHPLSPHHLPTELSGGQQQRAVIVRALIQAPAVLLALRPLLPSRDEVRSDGISRLYLELK